MSSENPTGELLTLITDAVEHSIATKRQLRPLYPAIARAAELLEAGYRRGGKAIFFGNGGSASDAQHLAAELSGRFLRDRVALPAMALGDNIAATTAIANDLGYTEVFARQLQALARPGDVAIALSVSGTSSNVVRAAGLKRELGVDLIALTGAGGGQLAPHADVLLAVPETRVPRVQEAHLLIGHILCEWVERALFP